MIADTSRSTSLPPNCTYHAFKMGLQRSGLSEWSTNRGGGVVTQDVINPHRSVHRPRTTQAHTHTHTPFRTTLSLPFPAHIPAHSFPVRQPIKHPPFPLPYLYRISSPAHTPTHSSSQFATPTWSQARETRRSVIAGRSTVAPFSSSYVMPLEQGARVSDKARGE